MNRVFRGWARWNLTPGQIVWSPHGKLTKPSSELPRSQTNWNIWLQITHWHSPRFHAYFPTGNSYPALVADMLSDAIACIGFSWVSTCGCAATILTRSNTNRHLLCNSIEVQLAKIMRSSTSVRSENCYFSVPEKRPSWLLEFHHYAMHVICFSIRLEYTKHEWKQEFCLRIKWNKYQSLKWIFIAINQKKQARV